MDIPTPIENRLVDLEIKAGFTEDLLDQLNDVIVRQQRQIGIIHRRPQAAALAHFEQMAGQAEAGERDRQRRDTENLEISFAIGAGVLSLGIMLIAAALLVLAE